MFFEEESKDTHGNMDDYDLNFEQDESVSWDKLLDDTESADEGLDLASEEKAEAAKKEKEHQAFLDCLAMDIINAVNEYLKVAAPEIAAKAEDVITPEEIHGLVDSIVKLMDLAESWKALEDVFNSPAVQLKKPVELTGSRLVDKNTTDYQKIMDEFFKSAGI